MQEKLSEFQVLDGCIYVSANIKEPGVILQHGEILRIFFGPREPHENCPKFKQIQKDFCDSGAIFSCDHRGFSKRGRRKKTFL